MRRTFIETLLNLASTDPRILLLVGDLGYTVVEPFAERFPERFINMGVAEQNMVGVATGMAEAGYIPFLYSIVPFATLRPYEFIRNGPVNHRLPVRIVGVGGGFEYGTAGSTHYGLEDVGVFRLLPGMTVIVPADYEQASTALRHTWDYPGPIYYRLGKDDTNSVPDLHGRFGIGKVQQIRHGSDIIIFSMGSISRDVLSAVDQLAEKNISCSMAVLSCISPAPIEEIKKIISQYPAAVSVEAHYVPGGIGSLISEVVAEYGLRCQVHCLGVKRAANGMTGSEKYMNHVHGISISAISKTVQEILKVKQTV